ncbi:MAG: hypothetical protein WBB45_20855 [Cyclobacteriaceae bacterium]
MSLTYVFLFIIFVADIVWVIIHFMRIANKRSGDEDDEGGILEDTDPVLDLPPGISLPEDGPVSDVPYPVLEEEVLTV